MNTTKGWALVNKFTGQIDCDYPSMCPVIYPNRHMAAVAHYNASSKDNLRIVRVEIREMPRKFTVPRKAK